MSDAQRLVFEKQKKRKDPHLNYFKKFYEEIKDKGLSNDDILASYDHTPIFFSKMRETIENKELWNLGILGEVASGKSTIMCICVEEGNKILQEKKILFKREDGTFDEKRKKSFSNLKQVVADQNEFMGIIKEELWSCFLGIDEYNRLADTGLNSSVDQVLTATYSDIFAQQNVHRISCSPSTLGDINTWLILEIYGRNMKEKTTTCKLIYRDVVSNTRQCIGRVDFYVGDIIKTKWYNLYRQKKFKRMELLQKKGVRKFSELTIASIVLAVYNDLENIVFEDRKVDPDVVLSSVKQIMKEQKFFASMLAEGEIASEVRNLLGLKHNVMKDSVKIWKEEEKAIPNMDFIKRLTKRMNLVERKLNKALNYHRNMKKVHEEYLSIK